ncbi:gliding motility-associated C-terminal domain-containing protein [Flammeovirga sp. OC4]|uniref:gliding motility-associated C-terminal domain-containing protein n=1 Tax=Flammeovirga sp. OC4 TaxID=1382345 RepID=UPI0005C62A21|nr:gliding motility-associated C-terminal domain-containing protein [Flammeovirga sp. OC4]
MKRYLLSIFVICVTSLLFINDAKAQPPIELDDILLCGKTNNGNVDYELPGYNGNGYNNDEKSYNFLWTMTVVEGEIEVKNGETTSSVKIQFKKQIGGFAIAKLKIEVWEDGCSENSGSNSGVPTGCYNVKEIYVGFYVAQAFGLSVLEDPIDQCAPATQTINAGFDNLPIDVSFDPQWNLESTTGLTATKVTDLTNQINQATTNKETDLPITVENIDFEPTANTATITLTATSACGGTSATSDPIVLTFYRTPEIAVGALTEVCATNGQNLGQVIAETTDPFTYAWDIGGASSGTVNLTGGSFTFNTSGTNNSGLVVTDVQFDPDVLQMSATFDISASGALGGCGGATDQIVVTFINSALKTVTSPFCSLQNGGNFTVANENTASYGYDYQWSINSITAGANVDLVAFGNDNSGLRLDNIVFNGDESVINLTLDLTVSGLNTTCNTQSYNVVINRTPPQLSESDITFCALDGSSGNAGVAEDTSPINGYTYTWSKVGTPANGDYDIIPSANGTGFTIDNVAFNNKEETITGVARLDITGLDPTCGDSFIEINITINRLPSAQGLTSIVLCADQNGSYNVIPANDPQDVVNGQTYNWSYTLDDPSLGSLTLSPTTNLDQSGLDFNNVTFNGSNTSLTGLVHLQVTGSICGATTTDIPFTIYRRPSVLDITSVELCATQNESLLEIITAHTDNFSGYDFNWTVGAINGGNTTPIIYGNNNSGVRFQDVVFDPNSQQITTTLDLVINGLASDCGNTMSIPVTIDRNPDVLANLTDFTTCQLDLATPGIFVVTPYTEDFPTIEYDWINKTETGGTTTLTKTGNDFSGLRLDDVDFDNGSSVINGSIEVTVTGAGAGCTATTQTLNYTIYRIPDGLQFTAPQACVTNGQNNVILIPANTEIVSDFNYTWQLLSINNGTADFSGIDATDNSGLSVSNIAFNTNQSQITATIRASVTNVDGSCNASSVDFTVTLDRTPQVTNIDAQTYCFVEGVIDQEVSPEILDVLTGYTYTWSLNNITNGTLTGTAFGNQDTGFKLTNVTFNDNQETVTADVDVEVQTASCGLVTHTIPVTINKIPDVINQSNIALCAFDLETNVQAITANAGTDVITGATYSYTVNTTDGVITTSQNGSDNSGLVFTSIDFNGNNTTISGTIDVEVTLPQCGTATNSIPFVIYRKPDQLTLTAIDLCAENGLASITAVTANTDFFAGYTFDWTLTVNSGGTMGMTTNGNNDSGVDFTSITFNANSEVITATLDLEVVGLDASCGNTVSIPVNVYRIPDVFANLTDFETCILKGTTTVDVVGTSTEDYPNMTFTWTEKVAPSNGSTITLDPYGTDGEALRFINVDFGNGESEITGTITLTVNNPAGGCATTKDFNYTIHRLPDGLQIGDQLLCALNGDTNIQLQSLNTEIVDNYAYQWSISNFTGGTATVSSTAVGVGSDGSDLYLNDINFNTGSSTLTATIRGTVIGMDNSCAGATKDITVTVHRIPDAFRLTDQSFCLQNGAVTETLASPETDVITGYTYTWTHSVTGGTITTSTTGTNNSGLDLTNVAFDPSATQITGTVTLTIAGIDGSCGTNSHSFNLTINRLPDNLSTTAVNLCQLDGDSDVNVFNPNAVSVGTFAYVWEWESISGGTVTLSGYGNNNSGLEFDNITFSGSSNIIQGTLKTTVNNVDASCSPTPIYTTVEIHRVPDLTGHTGPIEFCAYQGDTDQLVLNEIAQAINGYDFNWSIDNISNGTIVLDPSGNNNSQLEFDDITFDAGEVLISGDLLLEVNNVDASCGTISQTVPFSIHLLPDVLKLTGYSISLCSNATVPSLIIDNGNDTALNGYTYNWSFQTAPSGGTFDLPTTAQHTKADQSDLNFYNINFDASSTVINAVIRLTVTGLSTTCGFTEKLIPVVIDLEADDLNLVDQVVCAEEGETNVMGYAEDLNLFAGVTSAWTISNVSGGTISGITQYGNLNSGVLFDQVNFDADSEQITGELTLVQMTPNCTDKTETIDFTINRTFDLGSYTSIELCTTDNDTNTTQIFAPISDNFPTITYTWAKNGTFTDGDFDLVPSANNTGLSIQNIQFDDGKSIITGSVTLTVTTPDCGVITQDIPVNVTRKVELADVTLNDLCVTENSSGHILHNEVLENIAGFSYDWNVVTATVNGGTFDLDISGNNNSLLTVNNVVFDNNSIEITADITLSVSGSCDNSTVTKQIRIQRIPDLTTLTDVVICALQDTDGETIVIENTEDFGSGVTYNWSIATGTLSGGTVTLVPSTTNNNSGLVLDDIHFDDSIDPSSSSISFTVDLEVTGLCQTLNQSFTVQIDRAVDMSIFPASITECQLDEATDVEVIAVATETIDNFNYTWSIVSISGGTFSLDPQGTDASGLQLDAIQFDDSTTPSSATINAVIRVQNTNGCAIDSKDIPVTINRLPSINDVVSIETCVEESASGVLLIDQAFEEIDGYVYSWSYDNTTFTGGTADFAGVNTDGSGLELTSITFDANSATVSGIVTVNVSNSCGIGDKDIPFTLHRIPNTASITLNTACAPSNNGTATLFNGLSETLTDWTFEWDLIEGSVSGGSLTLNNTTTQSNEALRAENINFDANEKTITGNITLIITSTSCNDQSITLPFTINREIDLDAITLNELCVVQGSTLQILNAESTETLDGYAYNWTNLNITSVGSFTVDSDGNNNSRLLANDITFDANSLVINAEITLDVTGSCNTASRTIPITINRIPDLSSISNQFLCLVQNTTDEILVTASTETLGTIDYTWTIDASTLTGGSATLQAYGNNNSGVRLQTVTFDTNSDEITFTVDVSLSNACQGSTTSFDVTINRQVDFSLFPDTIEECLIDNSTGITVIDPQTEQINNITFDYEIVTGSLNGGSFTLEISGADNSGLILNDIQFDNTSDQIQANVRVFNEAGCSLDDKTIAVTIRRMADQTTLTGVNLCVENNATNTEAIAENEFAIDNMVYSYQIINVNGGQIPSFTQSGNNNSQLVLDQVIFDTDQTNITADIVLTVNNSCDATPVTIPLTLERTVDLSSITLNELCATDEDGSTIELYAESTENLPTWSYTWTLLSSTVTGGSFTLTPKGNQNSGLDVSAINFDEGSNEITASVNLTLTGSCNDATQTLPITIRRNVDLQSITLNELCVIQGSTAQILNPEATETIAGYTYNWTNLTITDGGSFTVSFDGNNNSRLLANDITFDANSLVINAEITLDVTGSCNTASRVIPIIINRIPDLSVISNQVRCLIQNTTDETLITASTETWGTIDYSWTIDASTLTGGTATLEAYGNNNSGVNLQTVTFDEGSDVITFTVNVTLSNACQGSNTSFDVTINRQVDFSLFPDTIDECLVDNSTGITVIDPQTEQINNITFDYEIVTGSLNGGSFTLETSGADDSGLILNAIQFDDTSDEIQANVRVFNESGCSLDEKIIAVTIQRVADQTTLTGVVLCLTNNATNIEAIEENEFAIDNMVFNYQIININGGQIPSFTQSGNNNSQLVLDQVIFDTDQTNITADIVLTVNNSCDATPDTIPLTINRSVDVASIDLNELCAFDEDGSTLELWAGNSENLPAWTYTWILLDGTTGGSFDLSTKGNQGSGLDVSAINFDDGSDVITGSVTLNTTGSCNNIVQTFTITIRRNVDLSSITDYENCVDGLEDLELYTSNDEELASIDHTWTSSVTGGSFTLVPTGNNNAGLTLEDITFDNNSYAITGTLTINQTGSCDERSQTVDINLYRAPEFTNSDTLVFCQDEINTIEGISSDAGVFNIRWEVASIDGASASGINKINAYNNSTSNTLTNVQMTKDDFDASSGLITVTFNLITSNSLYSSCESTQEVVVQFTRIPEITIPDAEAEGCSAVPVVLMPFGDEDFSEDYNYEWNLDVASLVGTSADGSTRIQGLVQSFTGQNLSITLEDTDYNNVNTQQINFDVTLTVTNKVNATCSNAGSTKTFSFTIHRSPLVGLPTDTLAVCEAETISIQSSYDEQSNIDYSWEILNVVGGQLSNDGVNQYSINVHSPVFDNDAYDIYADVVLTTVNKLVPDVCPGIDTAKVHFQRTPTSNFTIQNTVGCAQQVLALDASTSGIPNGENTYEWDFNYNGTFSADSSSTLPTMDKIYEGEGTYTIALRITSVLGCTSSIYSESITIYPSPVANFDIPDLICLDQEFEANNNGSTAGNPDGEITWEWYMDYGGNNTISQGSNSSINYSYPQTGNYQIALVITNSSGCQDVMIKEIDVIGLPETTFDPLVYICEGETATLSISGGESWEWSTGETASTINVTPTESQKYGVKSFNQLGCFKTDSIEVIVLPNGSGSSEVTACDFAEVTLSTIIDDPAVVKGIEWSTGETTSSIVVTEAGTFTYTLLVQSEPNANPCTYSHSITVNRDPIPGTLLPSDTTFCFEDDARIELVATKDPNVVVVWEDTEETTPTVTRGEEGVYAVKIMDTSRETACFEEYEINVVELCPPRISAPTGFTPNGDGLNDTFYIEASDLFNITLTIYNRWGEIIFYREYADEYELKDPKKGWDGTYRGRKVSIGDYVYTLTYESELYPGEKFRKDSGISVIY